MDSLNQHVNIFEALLKRYRIKIKMCLYLVWFDAVESTLDDKLLRELAENIGKGWKPLATELDFSTAHIEIFEHNYKDDLQQQAFQACTKSAVLIWRRK